jgi:DNA-binding NtrC family response regulator
MTSQFILIVDDEPDIRQLVSEILQDEGYEVATAENAKEAREKWHFRKPDLILLDIWMPDEDGISLLKDWQSAGNLCCPVVMMSGHATIETAVEATRLGAYDFIEKPLSMAKMLLTIENALRAGRLEKENRDLREHTQIVQEPIGSSEVIKQLCEQAKKIAQHSSTVFIYGEPGVGKEVFARYIHNHSSRAQQPFIKTIVSSLPDDDMSKKLFGFEENSSVQFGLLDDASSGTLYLSDISSLDMESQTRLFRALRENTFTRVGSNEPVDLNVRLIASATYDLRDDVEAGKFSEELYYLLNVVPLVVPPLREHSEDVPDLLAYYVDQLTEKDGLPYRHFSVAAQNHLRNHSWPGNIRELHNLVQRLLILGMDVQISLEEAEEALGPYTPVYYEGLEQQPTSLYDLPLRQAREQFEHDYLTWQLTQTRGNVSKLSERVQMERTHLYRKMRALDIDPRKFAKHPS